MTGWELHQLHKVSENPSLPPPTRQNAFVLAANYKTLLPPQVVTKFRDLNFKSQGQQMAEGAGGLNVSLQGVGAWTALVLPFVDTPQSHPNPGFNMLDEATGGLEDYGSQSDTR
jgi:hypothetical protein